MDIYEYLKMDHKKVADLFRQFEKSELLQRKEEVMAMIAQELIVHAESEQKTFYKALQNDSENEEDIFHAEKEHKEIEEKINLILHFKSKNASWKKHVMALKELVEHHVNDEEGKIFKEAKKVLSDEDAIIIKEQMHYLKGELLLKYKK